MDLSVAHLVPELVQQAHDLTEWRHRLHAHPEIAFAEHETARFVAEQLRRYGLSVTTSLAGTGVVATLDRGDGPAIGLRADMDGLPLEEQNEVPYRSVVPGVMHACGHDGHMAMLLGAARHLAAHPPTRGRIHFVFQPAEENEGGGRRMLEEGLLERFPMDRVFGLHNWPGLPLGTFGAKSGPIQAAFDVFELTIHGRGCHGAMPHQGIDPVVTAAQVVLGLQTVASRGTDPLDSVVVSVTQIHGGDAWNVIPDDVILRGTARWLEPKVGAELPDRLRRIATGVCQGAGAAVDLRYEHRYPPTINHAETTELAAAAAAEVVGAEAVDRFHPPCMGSEDFAFLLQERAGAYLWLGTGTGEDSPPLHNPRFNFNDDALVIGASYWVRLCERLLAAG